MSEMVSRVAEAIWAANGWHAPDEEDRRTLPWTLCIRQARAAIEAMRTSTPEVERAVAWSAWHMGSGRTAKQVINDMIDEALK